MKPLVGEYLDYPDLVKSMEYQIVLDEHDDDYQGDSYYLLRDGNRYGVLVFGWGSCSGCDALQACSGLDVARWNAHLQRRI